MGQKQRFVRCCELAALDRRETGRDPMSVAASEGSCSRKVARLFIFCDTISPPRLRVKLARVCLPNTRGEGELPMSLDRSSSWYADSEKVLN